MKLLALVSVILFAGCDSGNVCDAIKVQSMSGDVSGHVTLMGAFANAQPLLALTAMDGTKHVVVCVVGADSATADCNLPQNGIGRGSYTVGFTDSCNQDGKDPGAIDIGSGVPATLTVP